MNVRMGDFPFSSPSAPDNDLGPSSEGLFFWGFWPEAVFRLVGVDCVGGWIFSLASLESRRTGLCGAHGGIGMRGLQVRERGARASWACVDREHRADARLSTGSDRPEGGSAKKGKWVRVPYS